MDLPSWMWHEIKKCGAKILIADDVEKSGADSVEKSVAKNVEFYCRIHVSIFSVEILCRNIVSVFIVEFYCRNKVY